MNYPFSGIIVRYLRRHGTSVKADEQKVKDQLHVNLWDIGEKSYVDIGMMISDPLTVREIWVDLPWRVDHSHVVDLGPGLDGDKILTAIFNEVATYEGVSGEHYAAVTLGSRPKQEEPFLLVRLDPRKLDCAYTAVDAQSGVTRLRIRWPVLNYSKNEHRQYRRYIRVRITHAPKDVFFSTFRPKDRNLLSSSAITRLLDFRVNVRRGVPDQVLLGEPTLEFPRLRKVHVFAIVPRETELPFHSEGYKGCRSLEDEEIWNSYINLPRRNHGHQGETVKDYLGYQWTASGDDGKPAKDLVALGRFVHVTSSRWTNARFVAVVMLLGTLGSAVWDVVKASFGADTSSPSWRQLFTWLLAPAGLLLLLLFVDRATAREWARLVKQGWLKLRDSVGAWWADL